MSLSLWFVVQLFIINLNVPYLSTRVAPPRQSEGVVLWVLCKDDSWFEHSMAGIAGNPFHLGSNSSGSSSSVCNKRRTGSRKCGALNVSYLNSLCSPVILIL